eukprot:snap_masked-scaffold_19-processed-gene-3.33-mRNA-1 protein AED:1.00 eAED:1.00 QI:0/0/0/0/1/1/2/0/77
MLNVENSYAIENWWYLVFVSLTISSCLTDLSFQPVKQVYALNQNIFNVVNVILPCYLYLIESFRMKGGSHKLSVIAY